jgi:DNA processing protein
MDSIGCVEPVRVEKAALVALLRQPEVSWTEAMGEVLELGSPTLVLKHFFDGGDTLFAVGDPREALAAAEHEILSWEADGIGVHAFYEPSYPMQLRDIHELPPLIFTRGELRDDRRAVAVVGTRQASPRGLGIAAAVATALATNGVTVVSGLAAGIDTAAHTAALEAGGRTVAVIGTGIQRAYPAANAELQRRIGTDGLVLSQFWPDGPPSKKTFPMRNAVMSGYAAATVVIEAPWRSGARIQARLALQHGRPVVLPRELLEHDWAREYAERPGVFVVDNTDELLAVTEELVIEAAAGPEQLRGLSTIVQF